MQIGDYQGRLLCGPPAPTPAEAKRYINHAYHRARPFAETAIYGVARAATAFAVALGQAPGPTMWRRT